MEVERPQCSLPWLSPMHGSLTLVPAGALLRTASEDGRSKGEKEQEGGRDALGRENHLQPHTFHTP